jgi:putative ABC transport system permease protein
MWTDLFHRIRAIVRRKPVEREIDDELRFHIERQTEKYQRAGLNSEHAAKRARLEFGGLEQVKEDYRDSLGISLLETAVVDVRYTVRQMYKRPLFTAAIILTLGVCIGAVTAVFSMVDATLLRPLPYPEPERLAQLVVHFHSGDGDSLQDGKIESRYGL